MREYFYFNGKSSTDFDAYITNAGVYQSPAHSYEKISIPGKNGDLIFDKEKFDNVIVSYPAIIIKDFDANFDALKSYLLSINGYQRLSDSFHADEYYFAVFQRIENINVLPDHKGGTMNLIFDRKPQKFLKSGEKSRDFTGNIGLKNPTKYKAYPLIRLYGSGTFQIEDISLELNTSETYVDIDCDIQEALQAGENKNITLTNGQFPYLKPGNNNVSFTGSRYLITPRWFTI